MAPGGHSRRAGCGPCPTLTGGLEIGRGEIVFIRKQSVSPAPYPSSLSLLPCGFGFWGGFFFLSSQANLRILATKPGGACALPRGTAPAAPMPAGIPAPRCKPRDEPGEEAGAGPASQGRAADPTDPIGPRRPPPPAPGASPGAASPPLRTPFFPVLPRRSRPALLTVRFPGQLLHNFRLQLAVGFPHGGRRQSRQPRQKALSAGFARRLPGLTAVAWRDTGTGPTPTRDGAEGASVAAPGRATSRGGERAAKPGAVEGGGEGWWWWWWGGVFFVAGAWPQRKASGAAGPPCV